MSTVPTFEAVPRASSSRDDGPPSCSFAIRVTGDGNSHLQIFGGDAADFSGAFRTTLRAVSDDQITTITFVYTLNVDAELVRFMHLCNPSLHSVRFSLTPDLTPDDAATILELNTGIKNFEFNGCYQVCYLCKDTPGDLRFRDWVDRLGQRVIETNAYSVYRHPFTLDEIDSFVKICTRRDPSEWYIRWREGGRAA